MHNIHSGISPPTERHIVLYTGGGG